MSLISVDLLCRACNCKWWDLIERADKERTDLVCPHCEKPEGQVTISAPALMQASYPDGKRRFDKLRAADSVDRIMSETKDAKDMTKLAREKAKILTTKG